MSPWFQYHRNLKHFWSETTRQTVIQKFASWYSCAISSLSLNLLSTDIKQGPIYTVSQRTEASGSGDSCKINVKGPQMVSMDLSQTKFAHRVNDGTRGGCVFKKGLGEYSNRSDGLLNKQCAQCPTHSVRPSLPRPSSWKWNSSALLVASRLQQQFIKNTHNKIKKTFSFP